MTQKENAKTFQMLALYRGPIPGKKDFTFFFAKLFIIY